MSRTATLPPGFVLDEPESELPEGFVLDPAEPPPGFVVDSPELSRPPEPSEARSSRTTPPVAPTATQNRYEGLLPLEEGYAAAPSGDPRQIDPQAMGEGGVGPTAYDRQRALVKKAMRQMLIRRMERRKLTPAQKRTAAIDKGLAGRGGIPLPKYATGAPGWWEMFSKGYAQTDWTKDPRFDFKSAKEIDEFLESGERGVAEIVEHEPPRMPFEATGVAQKNIAQTAAGRLKYAQETGASYIGQEDDQDVLDTYLLRKYIDVVRPPSFWGGVLKGAAEMPAWMTEFIATGGVAGAGRKVGGRAAGKMLGKLVTKKGGRLALRLGRWTGAGIARGAAMPHRTLEAYAENMMPGFAIDEDGDIIITEADEKPATAFAKAFGSTVIEAMSEEAGARIMKGPKALVGKRIASALRKAVGTGRWARWVHGGFTRVGYHGVLGELGEERLAEVMRATFGVDKHHKGQKFFRRLVDAVPSGKQLLTETLIFAPIGAGQLAASAAAERLGPRFIKEIRHAPQVRDPAST